MEFGERRQRPCRLVEERDVGDQPDEVQQHPRGAAADDAEHGCDRGEEPQSPRGNARTRKTPRRSDPAALRCPEVISCQDITMPEPDLSDAQYSGCLSSARRCAKFCVGARIRPRRRACHRPSTSSCSRSGGSPAPIRPPSAMSPDRCCFATTVRCSSSTVPRSGTSSAVSQTRVTAAWVRLRLTPLGRRRLRRLSASAPRGDREAGAGAQVPVNSAASTGPTTASVRVPGAEHPVDHPARRRRR